jgi:hypothetical protein
MGLDLNRSKEIKVKAKNTISLTAKSTISKINLVVLTKEQIEASRPKDAYKYVL